MSFSGTEAVVWTLPVDSAFWASLMSPTTNLLKSLTVMDCGNAGDVGLPGGVAGGCGETDGFGAISIGAIVFVMEQHQRTKIVQASIKAVREYET